MKNRIFIIAISALLLISCKGIKVIKINEKSVHLNIEVDRKLIEIEDTNYHKAWEDPLGKFRINLFAIPFSDSVNNSTELILRIIEEAVSEKMSITNEISEEFNISLIEEKIGDSNSDMVKSINIDIPNYKFNKVLIELYGKYNTGLVLLEYFYNIDNEESNKNARELIKIEFKKE